MCLKSRYRSAPHKPGVYMFKDKDAKLLYIGKARDIKNRLASYILNKTQFPRIRAMLEKAKDIEWIITDNELEALILEANLIKQSKPAYNSDLKDDKRYPYLKITNEQYPRVVIVRRKTNDGATYFGPYADRLGAVKIMRTMRKLFPFRVCNHILPTKRSMRPCIRYDIGKCLAPCVNACSREEYLDLIEEITMFLRGKRKELIHKLEQKMLSKSEELEFEQARQIRDTIDEIKRMLTPQKMDRDIGDCDFIAIAVGGGVGVSVVFRIRQGIMIGRHNFSLTVPKNETNEETLYEFIRRFYAECGDIPPEVIIPYMPVDSDEVKLTLREIAKRPVQFIVPQRGIKKDTLKLAQHNAELLHAEIMLQKKKSALPYSILELERLLNLPKTPTIIEAFDISNIGTETAVASMVRFVSGYAKKDEYRRFNIRAVIGQDDFSAMSEVVYRRYKRVIEEAQTGSSQLPDLIVVDGGKGQLSSAITSLTKLGLNEKIPIIAIAKRIDEIFTPGKANPVMLPKDSSALRLLQRIRDEAHRFAIAFSRKSHRKKALELELMRIQGIGKKRAEKILQEFGGLEEIKKATSEEIYQKTKIPKKYIEKILAEIRDD